MKKVTAITGFVKRMITFRVSVRTVFSGVSILRMPGFQVFVIACLFSMTVSSCRHTKKLAQKETTPVAQAPVPVPPAQPKTAVPLDVNALSLLRHTKNNQIQFQELAAKLKTKVSSPSLNQSFTTNIRWKKGEKIWLSMTIIGIEGARVLITKDSIKIMDKINNRYILQPLSYIKQKTLVDLSFADIENLLFGQPVFTDSTKAKYTNTASQITISSDGARFLTNIFFDKSAKHPVSLFVTDKMYAQTIESSYSNYQQQLGKPFAMDRELTIRSGLEAFEMSVKFLSVEARQNLEYPFTINPNYTIEK